MTEPTTAYQRMLDWAQGVATQQTVIDGTRTITHQPLGAPGEREWGTIDADGYRDQDWRGDTVQDVIERMDAHLGKVPEGDYRIVEMAG